MTRQERSKWRSIIIVAVALLLLLTVGAVVGVRSYYTTNLRPLKSDSNTVSVTIPTGSTLRQTADLLKENNIIKSPWAFERYVRSNEAADKIKAGTYELSASYSVAQIVSIITEGKVATNLLTILPGQRLDQIKKTFLTSGFTQQEVDEAFEPSRYANHPALVDKPVTASLDGYLYPESFQLTAETTAQEIIESSLDQMQQRLTPAVRAEITRKGLTVHEGIILASIVENEVSSKEDRQKAAQVFIKRLNEGMKLQSNATDNLPPEYDTYSIDALPPGPISNVGETAIQAVAYPSSTGFLYFVSGKDCITRFSNTLNEHEALKAQYGVATPEDNCR